MPFKDLDETLLEELRMLLEKAGRPPPIKPGPPYEAYTHLPKHVRDWIETKDRKDFECLDQMLADYQSAKVVGRVGKWLALFIAGLFGTVFAIAKGGVEVLGWLKGVGR